jgi:hypothetical protein
VTDTLAKLNLPGASITLRRATREDLPAIVDLLVNDPLGSSREAASEAGDFGPYATAFAAIDTDPAQLLIVATDGIEVVATMQLSFIPGLARRGALEPRSKRYGSPRIINAGVWEPPCSSGPLTRRGAAVAP